MTNEMRGRTVLITGANAGIGAATALALAEMGARVLLAVRSLERGEKVRAAIAAAVPGASTELLVADLSCREGVHALAEQALSCTDRLDVLINNAGVFMRRHRQTVDGLETQFAVNHLAPFLLTALLQERLMESAPSRIVTVSSEAHRRGRIAFNDLQGRRSYSGLRAYAQSKLANLLFNRELARRLEGTGVTANALHPGVVATKLLFSGFAPLRLLSPFFKSPTDGARTSVFLASDSAIERVTGRYFIDCEPAQPSTAAKDDDAARRLWRISAELAGLETTESG